MAQLKKKTKNNPKKTSSCDDEEYSHYDECVVANATKKTSSNCQMVVMAVIMSNYSWPVCPRREGITVKRRFGFGR